MEFLIRLLPRDPSGLTEAEYGEILAAERRRGTELRREGTIKRIWRIRGEAGALAIWEAEDEAALTDLLAAMPMRPHMDVQVTTLEVHPIEA